MEIHVKKPSWANILAKALAGLRNEAFAYKRLLPPPPLPCPGVWKAQIWRESRRENQALEPYTYEGALASLLELKLEQVLIKMLELIKSISWSGGVRNLERRLGIYNENVRTGRERGNQPRSHWVGCQGNFLPQCSGSIPFCHPTTPQSPDLFCLCAYHSML